MGLRTMGRLQMTGYCHNNKAVLHQSGNRAIALHGQLTLSELLKIKKVNKEEYSTQITRIQDDSGKAQVHNEDDHSGDEPKTPESDAIKTDDYDDDDDELFLWYG